MGQITNPQIQPLSLRVERPENMTLYKMKYEFSKLFCPPSKTDIGNDEKWVTEPDSDVMAPQRTNETECQKKVCIKGMFLNILIIQIFFYLTFYII